jgi:hypothetical protein
VKSVSWTKSILRKPVLPAPITPSAFKLTEDGESEFALADVPLVVFVQSVFLEIESRAVSATVPVA